MMMIWYAMSVTSTYIIYSVADLLTKTVAEAHVLTSFYTREQLDRLRNLVAPPELLSRYKQLVPRILSYLVFQ